MLLLILPIITIAYKFWAITDIHLNVMYNDDSSTDTNCISLNGRDTYSEGVPYCDTPELLYKSAVENMKQVEPNPDFILIFGD